MSHEDEEKIKNILPSATYKFSDLCYKSELKYSTESMYHSDESDWSDFDEPSNKKIRLDENSLSDVDDAVIKNLDKCWENWRAIVKENHCDQFLIKKNVKRSSALGEKFETGVQLASFLNNAVDRHRRGGKKIPVQPMNVANLL
jgi:hypothetical protein